VESPCAMVLCFGPTVRIAVRPGAGSVPSDEHAVAVAEAIAAKRADRIRMDRRISPPARDP